jgi:hypothetical protein
VGRQYPSERNAGWREERIETKLLPLMVWSYVAAGFASENLQRGELRSIEQNAAPSNDAA